MKKRDIFINRGERGKSGGEKNGKEKKQGKQISQIAGKYMRQENGLARTKTKAYQKRLLVQV